MPTELISPGPVTPMLQNVVYALPASPCIVTGGVTLQKSSSFAGAYSDWVGSATGIYHGGSTIQSHVKCATGNTTIQAVKVKMTGPFAKGSYSASIAASGPSNYWQLNETSGLIAKDLIGGANGTISGGVTLNQPSGLSDGSKAMTFNGTTGKIIAGTVTIPLTCSIECWFKLATQAEQRPLFAVGSDNPTGYVGGGVLIFYDSAGSPGTNVSGLKNVTDGAWHHGVYVMDALTVSIYVDGVLDKSQGYVRTAPDTGVINLGYDPAWGAPPQGFFPGSLDDIAIYPRALTANEISAHYAAR